MNYPLISEYIEAIKSAEDNFEEVSYLRPVVGADGLETKVPISLDEDEIKALQESARTLKEVVDTIDWN